MGRCANMIEPGVPHLPATEASSFFTRTMADVASASHASGMMPHIPVGEPIPPNVSHAVSVSLPKWQDIVDYEEGRLTNTMQTGYPRFFIHHSIQKLSRILLDKFAKPNEDCILFVTPQHASQCRDFMQAMHQRQHPGMPPIPIRVVRFSMLAHPTQDDHKVSMPNPDDTAIRLYIVLFDREHFPLAKQFWQHTGLGISSRVADHCMRIIAHNASLLTPAGSQHEPRHHASLTQGVTPRGGGFGRRRYQSSRSLDALYSEPSPPSSSSNAMDTKDDEEGLTHEHSVFIEERFGRNLPFALAKDAKVALRRRIAGTLLGALEDEPEERSVSARKVSGVSEHDVFLFPSGMSSIYHAHQTLMLLQYMTQKGEPVTKEACEHALRTMPDPSFVGRHLPVGKSVCFGFPYTDTLKVLQKWGPGCHFFGRGTDDDLTALEQLLESQPPHEPKIHALFCEFPSNPLLRSADLPRIRRLADKYDFCVVIDETVGNFVNVEVLPYADLVVSSLTKVFSGDCNVMSGSLVLNPQSKHADALRAVLSANYLDIFWMEDAIFLERNSRDFVARIARIDKNAEAVADYMYAQSRAGGQADSVLMCAYYPKYVTREHYETCRRHEPYDDRVGSARQGGFGGLLSVEFVTQAAARAFYDALECAKGPSLGTNCTLACPYTLLAHYAELDWAAEMDVSDKLVRVSIGLEDTDALLRAFSAALAAAAAQA